MNPKLLSTLFIVITYFTPAFTHALPEALNSEYFFEDELGLSFEKPLCLASPPQESSLYVVEKEGRIYKIEDLSDPQKTLFLDISSKVDAKGESGLLGLAFHPSFKNNHTFFIFYSTLESNQRYQILSKMIISDHQKIEEIQLIKQFDEAGNHNGGDLHFGPDGYLYVSLGDEGKSGDHFKNSQRIDKDFFSAIMRIDVDMKPQSLWPNPHPSIITNHLGQSHYKIPKDNPWIDCLKYQGKTINKKNIRTEFYAIGFRNPWRMSFDPQGNLWIGDVGQGIKEEINLIPTNQKGLNFGWAHREGSLPYTESQTSQEPFTEPIYEYGRQGLLTTYLGRSVTGGVVNQSDRIPELQNKYIFADYINGNVWSLDPKQNHHVELVSNFMNISAFGLHPVTGEVLACGLNSGKIKTLKKSILKNKPLPQNLSETGLFKSLSPIVTNSDLVPYKTNVNAWSDHAKQQKWFHLPEGEKFSPTKNTSWVSPKGSIWVQHFQLEAQRGQPQSSFHVETRILVKTHDGIYGLSYQWNEEQTDAKLVHEYGASQIFEIESDETTEQQTWKFPSRMECMMCHNNISGFNLGFNTRQLNHTLQIDGKQQNYIDWLHSNHYIDQKPNPKDLSQKLEPLHSKASLEQKARSYLDVNCSTCHQKGGTTPITMDLRSFLPFEETKLNRRALMHLGQSKRKIVDPGKVNNSVIINRMQASGGFTRMPFLGSTEVDQNAIEIISEWIESLQK